MPTLDSQVHAYERNHPGRPWAGVLHGPAEVTGDQMVAAMDAVAVDGAVLVSPFSSIAMTRVTRSPFMRRIPRGSGW
jgi:L-fuconolactonase